MLAEQREEWERNRYEREVRFYGKRNEVFRRWHGCGMGWRVSVSD